TPAANYAGNDVLTMTVVAPNVVPDASTLTNRDTKKVLIRVIPKADAPFLQTFPASSNENTAIPLVIGTALADTDAPAVLTVLIGGVPAGAKRSAGLNLGGGQWLLTQAQLAGLTITPPPDSDVDFVLTVTATSTEGPAAGTASTGPLFLPVTVNGPTPPPPPTSVLVGAGPTEILITPAGGLPPVPPGPLPRL